MLNTVSFDKKTKKLNIKLDYKVYGASRTDCGNVILDLSSYFPGTLVNQDNLEDIGLETRVDERFFKYESSLMSADFKFARTQDKTSIVSDVFFSMFLVGKSQGKATWDLETHRRFTQIHNEATFIVNGWFSGVLQNEIARLYDEMSENALTKMKKDRLTYLGEDGTWIDF